MRESRGAGTITFTFNIEDEGRWITRTWDQVNARLLHSGDFAEQEQAKKTILLVAQGYLSAEFPDRVYPIVEVLWAEPDDPKELSISL